jgi:tetratricopeptide (TPR) repeat protein
LYRGELALTLWDQGKLQEADQQLRAAIRIRSASIGDRHPDVARLRGNLASLLQQRGQLTEAEAEHRAVLQLLTARLPDDQLDVILARNNLATVLLRLERPAEALVNAEKAYAGLSPQTSPAVRAFVTSTLARVLGEAGSSAKERARARRIAEESIAAHEAASDQERADSMREWIETALPTTPHSGP